MDFASWKDRKSVAQALRTVYRAADAAAGQAALDAFAQGPWATKYPHMGAGGLWAVPANRGLRICVHTRGLGETQLS